MPTADDVTARLRTAADRVRAWFQRQLDAGALDVARLYAAQRDRFVYRIGQIYQAYLADDPTLLRARVGPAGLLLDQAIGDTTTALGDELGAQAVNSLTGILDETPAQVRRRYARWSALDFAALPVTTQRAVQELTTAVFGGGTFFDRTFNITDRLRSDLVGTVRTSLINGDDFMAVRGKVMKLFGVDTLPEPSAAAYGSVRTYRNAAASAFNDLMRDISQDAGGIEVWWCELDDTTTPGCAARHGMRIGIRDGEVPPRHTNCRCSVAIFDATTDLSEFIAEGDAWLAQHGYSRREARFEEAFDPAKHPRAPAGSAHGGEFASAGTTEDVRAYGHQLGAKHGADVSLFLTHQGDLHLQHISIPKDKRGSGDGSAVMRDLVAYADHHGKRITLDPAVRDEHFGTTSRARLVKWYQTFGFVQNKGRNTDFRISAGMYRDPQKAREAYNPEQPRVPAGSPEGGQWAGGADGQGAAATDKGGVQDGGGVSGRAPGVGASVRPGAARRLDGLPEDSVGPNPKIRSVAEAYMARTGREYSPPTDYRAVDPAASTHVAQAFEAMQSNPNDPAVKASYQALIDETHQQFLAMQRAGVTFGVIDYAKTGDPYRAGASALHEDLRDHNHMWLFPTTAGFGSDASVNTSKNPLLAKSGGKIGGYALTANDEFRLVHDYFGHAKEGLDFSPAGEENAWRMHLAMYSKSAGRAMTAETRGQTAWVYFGPHGASNRSGTAPIVFAAQKTGLLPRWASRREAAAVLHSPRGHQARSASDEGRQGDERERGARALQEADGPGSDSGGRRGDPSDVRGAGVPSGAAGHDHVTPAPTWGWGPWRLRPLYHVPPARLTEASRSTEYRYRSHPWATLPAVAVGHDPGPWHSAITHALRDGGPADVLLRREAGRSDLAYTEVLAVEGWVPLAPRSGTWIPVPGGRALDSPDGAHWQPRRRRATLDVIEAWPGLREVTFHVAHCGDSPQRTLTAALLTVTEAEALAAGETFEGEQIRDLGEFLTHKTGSAAAAAGVYLALGGHELDTIVNVETGEVLYTREAFAGLASPYQRAAVAVFEGEGLVWAIKPRPPIARIGPVTWVLPGGHIDDGERPVDAAIREMGEETGVTACRPRFLGRLYQPWATTHVFVAEREGEPEPPTTPEEISGVQLVSLDDLNPVERAFLVRHARATTQKSAVATQRGLTPTRQCQAPGSSR